MIDWRMNLGQGGVCLANLQLRYDIVALQVAKINAHQLLQTFILLPLLAWRNDLSFLSEVRNLAARGETDDPVFHWSWASRSR